MKVAIDVISADPPDLESVLDRSSPTLISAFENPPHGIMMRCSSRRLNSSAFEIEGGEQQSVLYVTSLGSLGHGNSVSARTSRESHSTMDGISDRKRRRNKEPTLIC